MRCANRKPNGNAPARRELPTCSGAGSKRGRSIWLPLAALLAGLNIALLALLWYSSERPPEGMPAPVAPLATLPAPAATPRAAEPVAAARSLSDEMEDPARFAAIAPPTATSQPAAEDIEIPPAPQNSNRMLTVTEAMLDGSLNVRPLRLELHVYSANPAERFVFINTARYGEGDQTSEGPVVRSINEDGVILSYEGRDYLLARE